MIFKKIKEEIEDLTWLKDFFEKIITKRRKGEKFTKKTSGTFLSLNLTKEVKMDPMIFYCFVFILFFVLSSLGALGMKFYGNKIWELYKENQNKPRLILNINEVKGANFGDIAQDVSLLFGTANGKGMVVAAQTGIPSLNEMFGEILIPEIFDVEHNITLYTFSIKNLWKKKIDHITISLTGSSEFQVVNENPKIRVGRGGIGYRKECTIEIDSLNKNEPLPYFFVKADKNGLENVICKISGDDKKCLHNFRKFYSLQDLNKVGIKAEGKEIKLPPINGSSKFLSYYYNPIENKWVSLENFKNTDLTDSPKDFSVRQNFPLSENRVNYIPQDKKPSLSLEEIKEIELRPRVLITPIRFDKDNAYVKVFNSGNETILKIVLQIKNIGKTVAKNIRYSHISYLGDIFKDQFPPQMPPIIALAPGQAIDQNMEVVWNNKDNNELLGLIKTKDFEENGVSVWLTITYAGEINSSVKYSTEVAYKIVKDNVAILKHGMQ